MKVSSIVADAADAMYVCGDCRGCQVRYPGCYDLRVEDRVPVPPERLAAAAAVVAEHWRAEDAAWRKPGTEGQGCAAAVAAMICFAVLGSLTLAVLAGNWLAANWWGQGLPWTPLTWETTMTNSYDLGQQRIADNAAVSRWPVAVMFGVGVWIGVGLLSAIALAMWITS